MPEIHFIKHLRENEDLSFSEIARRTEKDWRTIEKYEMERFQQVKLVIEKVAFLSESTTSGGLKIQIYLNRRRKIKTAFPIRERGGR